MAITTISREKRIFTIQESRELLPLVKKITENVVQQVKSFANRIELLSEEDPEFEEIKTALDTVIREWSEKLEKLGCEVKGLWLVDFDNGHGYYCWSYPEAEIDHFHGYEEGFSGRTRIC